MSSLDWISRMWAARSTTPCTVAVVVGFPGTAVALEFARKLGVRRLLLVINKVLLSLDAESLRQQVQKTCNATVASVLPLSEEMVRMRSEGLFTQVQSDHLYSKGVRNVADRLLHLNRD